jgi:hypothetical protein
MLMAYWTDEPEVGRLFHDWELDFLDPYEATWLDDLAEVDADGPEPPRTADGLAGAAVDAGYAELARHIAFVGTWNNNSLFGYWLHPQEEFGEFPPVIEVDSEAEISILGRDCNLAEALTGTSAEGDDARFDRLAQMLRNAGVPVERRGRYGRSLELTVHPEVVYEEARKRELERLTAELEATRQHVGRSGTAVEATDLLAVLGKAAGDPAVADVLTTLGLPAAVEFRADDISRTVTEPVRGVELTFQRADEIRDEREFGVPADDPITAVVAFVDGCTFARLPHDLAVSANPPGPCGTARTAADGGRRPADRDLGDRPPVCPAHLFPGRPGGEDGGRTAVEGFPIARRMSVMALRPRAAQQHVHGTSGQRAVASAAAAALTVTRVPDPVDDGRRERGDGSATHDTVEQEPGRRRVVCAVGGLETEFDVLARSDGCVPRGVARADVGAASG